MRLRKRGRCGEYKNGKTKVKNELLCARKRKKDEDDKMNTMKGGKKERSSGGTRERCDER